MPVKVVVPARLPDAVMHHAVPRAVTPLCRTVAAGSAYSACCHAANRAKFQHLLPDLFQVHQITGCLHIIVDRVITAVV